MKTTTQTMPLAIAPVKGVKHHEKKANINLFYPVYEYSERLFFYIFLGLFLALSLMHLCGIFLYGEHETAMLTNWSEHLLIFRFGLFAWAAALDMMILHGSLHLGKKWLEGGKPKSVKAFRRVAVGLCATIVLVICTLFGAAWLFAIPFACLLVFFATPFYGWMIKEGHRSALWLVVCIEVVTVCLISVVLFLAEIQVVTGDLAGFVRHVLSSCLKGR